MLKDMKFFAWEKTVKKRIIGVLCMVICACLLMTGCGLWKLNQDRYLSRTVATVDDDIVVTKEDLLTTYNQYAATLINNYKYTNEKAIEYCIDLLINKKIMLKKAKEIYPNLTDKELSKCWKDTYDTMNEILADYESAVKVDWDIKDDDKKEDTAGSTDSSSTSTAYKAYEKKAKLVQNADGVWEIQTIPEEDELADVEVIEGGADKFLTTYRVVTREDVSKEALKRYIKALKKNEEGRTFEGENAYSDDAVLNRAINRVYTQIEESYYLSKLKKHLVKDTSVSVEQILNAYKEKLISAYTKYGVGSGDFGTDILNSAENMYYVPENAQGKFFYVSHFLVKFNTEEQAQVDDLKEQMKQGYIAQSEYDMGVEAIVANMKATVYDDEGKATDTQVLVKDLIASLNAEMAGKSQEEKTEIFRQYLYKYNEDTSFNNKEYPYVVGDEKSTMVESFTNAARKLHRPNDENKEVLGKIGDISGIVPSEYGIHILMYCGEVQNLFDINKNNANEFEFTDKATYDEEGNMIEASIKILYDTLLNACNNKTIFDKLYDEVFKDNYSVFESAYLQSLKQGSTIKIYKKAYKDLLG